SLCTTTRSISVLPPIKGSSVRMEPVRYTATMSFDWRVFFATYSLANLTSKSRVMCTIPLLSALQGQAFLIWRDAQRLPDAVDDISQVVRAGNDIQGVRFNRQQASFPAEVRKECLVSLVEFV